MDSMPERFAINKQIQPLFAVFVEEGLFGLNETKCLWFTEKELKVERHIIGAVGETGNFHWVCLSGT